MYLLDTNVISELRKLKPHGGVLAWLRGVPANLLFVSAFTLAELQAGVERTRRQDRTKAAEIDAWIDQVVDTFDVISMDASMFREWAKLMERKSSDLTGDAMLAATARIRGLVVVTRNVRDFAIFGVEVLNPFQTQ